MNGNGAGKKLKNPTLENSARLAAENKPLEQNSDHASRSLLPAEVTDIPTPTWLKPVVEDFDFGPGMSFCGYRLVSEIGRGGMGRVFLAEREGWDGRKVAVKFLGVLVHHPEFRKRFEMEQQSLARMNHPNIAQLLDTGICPNGQPFFVMEYLDGLPIDVYCDQKGLSLTQRMDVFIKVCDALSHAHLKGIVHRDLKPSNVLVVEQNGNPEPKVIDFGIAKLIDGDMRLTNTGRHMGTFRYMSPEQAGATDSQGLLLDLDSRTDVYSLGVILFELFVGSPPLAWSKQTPWPKVLTDICQKPPLSLSQAWQNTPFAHRRVLAASRSASVQDVSRKLRGDLSWIVKKALQKDPERRYRSPLQLAEDIHRHTGHRPVKAGGRNNWYVMGKYLRRNPIKMITAASLITMLAGFGILMSFQQRKMAKEHDKAQQVTQLMTDLFTIADTSTANLLNFKKGDEITVKDILDRGVQSVDTHLHDRPELQAQLLATFGKAYANLSLFELGTALLERAMKLRAQHFGIGHPLYLESLVHLAEIYRVSGQYALAEAKLRHALDLKSRHKTQKRGGRITIQNELAVLLMDMGQFQEAKILLESSLNLLSKCHINKLQQRIKTYKYLGMLQRELGAYGQAEAHLLTALSLQESKGKQGLEAINIKAELAIVHNLKGDFREAETIYRETLAFRQRSLGEHHPETARNMSQLAFMLSQIGALEEAERLHKKALENMKEVLGEDHLQTAFHYHHLAALLVNKGRFQEAKYCYQQALRIREKMLSSHHPDVADSYNTLGGLLSSMGKNDLAQQAYCKSWEIAEDVLGDFHPDTLSYQNNLAVEYMASGHPDAVFLLEQILDYRMTLLSEHHPDLGVSFVRLGNLYSQQDSLKKAERYLQKGLEILAQVQPGDHQLLGQTMVWLGENNLRQNRFHKARTWFEAGLIILTDAQGDRKKEILNVERLLSQTARLELR